MTLVPLFQWLFRIAYNRYIDFLRRPHIDASVMCDAEGRVLGESATRNLSSTNMISCQLRHIPEQSRQYRASLSQSKPQTARIAFP